MYLDKPAYHNSIQMYASYQTALTQAAATSLDPALADFENTFAPVPPPPSDVWLEILLSVVDLVGTVAVSSFFNSSMFLHEPKVPVLSHFATPMHSPWRLIQD